MSRKNVLVILGISLLLSANVIFYFNINVRKQLNVLFDAQFSYKTLDLLFNNEIINNTFNNNTVKNENIEREFNGTCNADVWQIGYHQKVISYCFADHLNKFKLPFWRGFNQTLNNISTLYPGWQVRVYATSKDILLLQSKVTKRNFLYFCDVEHLPEPLNSLKEIPIRMWRFAPMGDPQIDLVIFRDIDSEVIQREVDAVSEWLSTKKTLHVMRDHKYHNTHILAGMWGLKMNDSNRIKLLQMRDQMFNLGKGQTEKKSDQIMLKKVVWPVYENDVIGHDSFFCKNYKGSKPFPTKRVRGQFVAQRYNVDKPISFSCPARCRPKKHRRWKFC